jgi:hypothetical protein
MNKNQKHLPYTYSQMIKANRMMARFCEVQISELLRTQRKQKTNGKSPSDGGEKLASLRKRLEDLYEEYSRYSIARSCCGDATVIIR